jgi:hypothetical protein
VGNYPCKYPRVITWVSTLGNYPKLWSTDGDNEVNERKVRGESINYGIEIIQNDKIIQYMT